MFCSGTKNTRLGLGKHVNYDVAASTPTQRYHIVHAGTFGQNHTSTYFQSLC